VGLTHFDEAPSREYVLGHLRNRWTMLGEAAGCERAGVRRIQIEPGGWSTPAHEHGRSEEIFYVLAGSGVSWQRGRTAPIRAGDCIVYLARRGAHTLHAGGEEIPVGPGHVIGRPAGTGVAHTFRAGAEELTFLAYGSGDRGDVLYFPRSGKIALPGIGVVARLQRADYWDGED
jgi:uncharacterized cupin superfamily protein